MWKSALPELINFDKSDCSLNGISLLTEASPEKITELENSCEWIEYNPKDIIIDLNDNSTSVYFVVKGTLQVLDFMNEDQVVALADMVEGDTIGELSAIDLKVRSARVSASEATLLAKLSSKEFRSLLVSCPEISLALLKQFAGYIRTMNSRVTALSTMTAHQRVYYELIRIAEPNTEGDGSWVIMNAPGHADIASKAGADRSDVATAIGRLARDGVIERKHKQYTIKDFPRLQRLADQ